MKTYTIYRKCPFCEDKKFQVDEWEKGKLYLLKCLNKNVSAAMWTKPIWEIRFRPIEVTVKPSNTTLLKEYKDWKRNSHKYIASRKIRKDKWGNKVATYINERGVEKEIPDVPVVIRQDKKWGRSKW